MSEASVGYQCPSCVAEGRSTQRQARGWFGGGLSGQQGYVTMAIIGLNVAVFLISILVSKGQAIGGSLFGGSTVLHEWGGMAGPNVALTAPCGDEMCYTGETAPGMYNGGLWRLVTPMFLHYGPLHLLLNMWAVWVLGRNLEYALGPLRFAALYLLAGMGGNVAALLFQPNAPTAGASTAIFGLFGAIFLVLRKLGRSTSAILPVLIVNVVITFVGARYISVAGHMGGLVIGAAVAAGLVYAPAKQRTAVQVAVVAGMTLFLLALTAFAIVTH